MSRKFDYRWVACFLALFLTGLPAICFAAFGEDLEKPRPEFSQEADGWVAKLIPRGKSSSVQIRFKAAGASLSMPEGVDFETAQRHEVDVKDFRSALFSLHMTGVSPGGDVSLVLSSTYFNTSTQLWVFNPNASPAWADMGATAFRQEDRVCDLTVSVRDGGPTDADGAADGQISLVVAPRDSFWGYALGTLLIRFFGIFIVLSVLMLGMILSGRVFRSLDQKASRTAPETTVKPPEPAVPAPDSEVAAAVAVALHFHLQKGAKRAPGPLGIASEGESEGWKGFGRAKLMTDRMPVFERTPNRQKNGWSK